MEALVYVRADPGKALGVVEALKGVEGVKEAWATTGRFDAVARVEAPDLKAIGELVCRKIQALEGVRSTETSLIVS